MLTEPTAPLPVIPPLASPAPRAAASLGLTVYGCDLAEARAFAELARHAGITPTITAAPPTRDSARAAAGDRMVSVGHHAELTADVLRALRDVGVEYVSTRSVGVDHIDLAAADELGMTVENVLYDPDGVADHTVLLLLLALRHARPLLRAVDAGDLRLPATRARELRGLTVGVIGAGRIGHAVIGRLRGFGCRILAADDGRGAVDAGDAVPIDELLRESDVVTLHAPLTPATRHLLSRERIAAMKPGAILVNTARGALVDTDALVAALASGRLAGAGLDVLEGERAVFGEDHRRTGLAHPALERLLRLPNVVVTPHVGYYTEGALRDIVERTLAGCVEFARRRADG